MSADASLNDILGKEKKLMADINNFNKIYSCYLHDASYNTNNNVRYVTPDPACSSIQHNSPALTSAYNLVNDDIANLRSVLQNYRGPNKQQYDVSFNNIINTYKNIMQNRTDMDKKLAELYNIDDGINNYYNNKYATTMFSKIMLTILVTCLVYYTFRKLIKK